MLKSKKQKTAGWLLLTGGSVVSVIGLGNINLAGSVSFKMNSYPLSPQKGGTTVAPSFVMRFHL